VPDQRLSRSVLITAKPSPGIVTLVTSRTAIGFCLVRVPGQVQAGQELRSASPVARHCEILEPACNGLRP
jgi:hypothetical protein